MFGNIGVHFCCHNDLLPINRFHSVMKVAPPQPIRSIFYGPTHAQHGMVHFIMETLRILDCSELLSGNKVIPAV